MNDARAIHRTVAETLRSIRSEEQLLASNITKITNNTTAL